jgi:predicted transposase YbfD/YdcC
VLGQRAVADKSNEITAIPVLIENLDLGGAVVSIDAMGTQKDIAWTIREQHAEYVLALKDNHPKLYDDVCWLFDHAQHHEWQAIDHDYWQCHEHAHGREELRRCWVLKDLSYLAEHQGCVIYKVLPCSNRTARSMVFQHGKTILSQQFTS